MKSPSYLKLQAEFSPCLSPSINVRWKRLSSSFVTSKACLFLSGTRPHLFIASSTTWIVAAATVRAEAFPTIPYCVYCLIFVVCTVLPSYLLISTSRVDDEIRQTIPCAFVPTTNAMELARDAPLPPYWSYSLVRGYFCALRAHFVY